MTDRTRLIERVFPLKQASLDSVHEKNVRHGHISTLHIWPARRPLAACRAALIATLLPDPGDPDERRRLIERIGGRVVPKIEKKNVAGSRVEVEREETAGGILHWGRESSPDLQFFRDEIRKAYGGRAPRVLDPFAGGGAIPLEAMRLGCEVTAIDINPVAWFILKCTLEYPQKLAGQKRPLPDFVLRDRDFMEAFFKAQGLKGATLRTQLERLPIAGDSDSESGASPAPAARPLPAGRGGEIRFSILSGKEAATQGGNGAQRREYDKKIGAGTMSRAGATCVCCGLPSMTMEDIRLEGKAGRLGAIMTVVVVNGPGGKEYRLPTDDEIRLAAEAEKEIERVFAEIPFGIPDEPLPGKEALGFRVPLYGFDRWSKLFTPRQLLALGTFVKHTRAAAEAMESAGYPALWKEGIDFGLATSVSRLADYSSSICLWALGEFLCHTFTRFASPITWDFVEGSPLGGTSGNYEGAVDWVSRVLENLADGLLRASRSTVLQTSAIAAVPSAQDLVFTDPPYYDAIPYADLMDFFYVWLRRTLHGLSPEIDDAFREPLGPKWNTDKNDGELIDDSSRFGGDKSASKNAYEDGMFRAFQACDRALVPDGRMVVVFANKSPDAWETLVSAIIRAGFVVDASWPIQTEREARIRAYSSAALASSVWLVCRKRPEAARPGWDNRVLDEMRENIYTQLSEYWDAGIRGPDFVWAATGPAMEAYSKHPVVKKASEPGAVMEVSEFLRAVRRIVVDFVVGRVLTHNGDAAVTSGLDDVTTYYLLHRHDFGMGDAPVGACILYAISCGLSDHDLADRYEILQRAGASFPLPAGRGRREAPGEGPLCASDLSESEDSGEDFAADGAEEAEEGSGSRVRLRPWNRRIRKSLGYDSDGRPAPLIDQAHRLMHLWRAGDVVRVDEYLDARGLRRNALFHQLLQALIELAPAGSEERSLLESISNHISARPVSAEERQAEMFSHRAQR